MTSHCEDPLVWSHVFFLIALGSLFMYTIAYVLHIKRRQFVLAMAVICAFGWIIKAPTKSYRVSLLDYERRSYPSLSYSMHGPGYVHGVSNYKLILNLTLGPVAIYFMDSGGGRIPDVIHENQIRWLQSVHVDHMPSIAFVHIPPFPVGFYRAPGCTGSKPLEPSSSILGGALLLDALDAMNTSAVFVGHDHGNEWCCMYKR